MRSCSSSGREAIGFPTVESRSTGCGSKLGESAGSTMKFQSSGRSNGRMRRRSSSIEFSIVLAARMMPSRRPATSLSARSSSIGQDRARSDGQPLGAHAGLPHESDSRGARRARRRRDDPRGVRSAGAATRTTRCDGRVAQPPRASLALRTHRWPIRPDRSSGISTSR